MNSGKSTRKTQGIQKITCETCAFFDKPVLCPRREKYAGAIPCQAYQRKTFLQKEATFSMYPLLPDVGLGKPKEESVKEISEPSVLWYLVPFLFGILGGVVAYVGVKDKDESMALGLLLFGIIWTFIAFFLYLYIIAIIL